MNTNDKFNVAGDRPLGAAKPVDPATRLSELLAQSLEELTRPFDPPRVDPLTRSQPTTPPPGPASAPAEQAAAHDDVHAPTATESRLDDRALAELEAELFAAASKPASKAPAVPGEPPAPAEERHDLPFESRPDEPRSPAPDLDSAAATDPDRAAPANLDATPDPFGPAPALPAAPARPAAADDDAAAQVVAKVRRLMLISMLVTLIAVGSVFGFIGYRVFKGDGSTAKTADKLPETVVPSTDMVLALPRGARVVQSAVAEDRLIVTLDIGGKTEVRTFDLKTLQPAGRLTFSTTP